MGVKIVRPTIKSEGLASLLLTDKTLIRKVSHYLDYVLKERRHKLRVT